MNKFKYRNLFHGNPSANPNIPIDKHKKYMEMYGEVMAEARVCIGTDQFQSYKKRYFEVREELIEGMIHYTEPDPIKYAFAISIMAERLRSMGALLVDLEKDVNALEGVGSGRRQEAAQV